MTRRWLLSGLIAGGVAVALTYGAIAWFLHTSRGIEALQRDLRQWQAKLADASGASARVVSFAQTQESAVAQQEQTFQLAIPLNEPEPFSLIKQLTRLAERAGAQQLAISIRPRRQAMRSAGPSGTSPVGSSAFLASSPSPAATPAGAAEPPKADASSPSAARQDAPHVYQSPIRLEFELEFPRLLDFLQSIGSLERLTTIENLRVVRTPKIFPRQKIILTLDCYTILSP